MRLIAVLLPALALLYTACGVHTQTTEGTDADDVKAAGETTAEAGDQPRAGACSIPEGLTPGTPSLAMPQVVAPEDVTFEREEAMIELGEDGKVLVRFEFDARNRGDAAAEIIVGVAWRIAETGPEAKSTVGDLRIDAAGAPIQSCSVESPEEIHQPFRDDVHFVKAEIAPDAKLVVKGSFAGLLDRAEKPTTLFGYHDRFADNWKNWDWPYTKSEPYAEIADQLKPYHGRFDLGPASRSTITIRPHRGDAWMRTMSHEQNVEKLRMPGAYRWSFWGDVKPAQVEFEYVVGLSMATEIEVFRKIVKKNRFDLRARIRLADLAGFAGDPAARAEIIEGLLKYWKKHAKEQLLINRNDVRGPAYVVLVKSLVAIDEKGEAAKRAQEGIEVIKQIEADGQNSEMNRLAREWLETQL